MTKINVSKLDAAKRQLDCAIRLWFSDDDPVVIHALAWAAFQIVQDINEKQDDKSHTLLEMTREVIKPEHVEDAMALLRKPMTFLKHANRDPHGILEFESDLNEGIIGITIICLGAIGENRSDYQTIFLHYERLYKPEWFNDSKEVFEKLGTQRMQILKTGTKREFLDIFLETLVRNRVKR